MLLSIADGVDDVIQFITVLVIFVFVLGITMFVTKWVGKYQKMQNSGKNIDVLESVRISPSAYVEILRVGKKYIAVAVAKENVTYLCDVSEDELVFAEDGSVSALSFDSILSKVRGAIPTDKPDGKDEDI